MIDHDKHQRDKLEIQWITIISAFVALIFGGFIWLDARKLDKAVYEESLKRIEHTVAESRDDIRAIRETLDEQRPIRFKIR